MLSHSNSVNSTGRALVNIILMYVLKIERCIPGWNTTKGNAQKCFCLDFTQMTMYDPQSLDTAITRKIERVSEPILVARA